MVREQTISLAPAFVDFVQRIDADADGVVLLAVEMVVRASETGHVCFPLAAGTQNGSDDLQGDWQGKWRLFLHKEGIGIATISRRLLASKVVGHEGEVKPFVLDQRGRLYLYRYWRYEKNLAEHLLARVAHEDVFYETGQISSLLATLFPEGESGNKDMGELDWQKIACLTALFKKFTVICGGPGTGKTFTVVKLMALLVMAAGQAENGQTPDGALRFGLAAPTGKAAARLQDSIAMAKRSLSMPEDILNALPGQVQTIHRLLGYRKNSPYFRHDKNNPLDLDVLIVDEASMVDLALMAKIFAALPEQCRVILIGDKDQLSSVEAGQVLGDICHKESNSFSRSFLNRLNEFYAIDGHIGKSMETVGDSSSNLADAIVILEKSYRFDSKRAIGRLAKAINKGSLTDVRQCFVSERLPNVDHESMSESGLGYDKLLGFLCDKYSDYLKCLSVEEAFSVFERFRLLCVHRSGMYGAQALNKAVEENMVQRGLIPPWHEWYAGRPIIITRNDYTTQLFNGDSGIVLPGKDGELRVFFQGPQGSLRSFAPFRLPAHETSFALTVHKSQGSEFDHVALLLPPENSPVLCRELLYTAVTRARKQFTLWGSSDVLEEGLGRKVRRSSGLAERLYGIEKERMETSNLDSKMRS